MLVIDSHLDLGWNALQWNRDLLSSVLAIRAGEAGTEDGELGQGTVALPEMREGEVVLSFATLLARSTGQPSPNIDYPSPVQAYGAALGQLAYYRGLACEGAARIITDRAGLDLHISEWENRDAAWAAGPQPMPPLGFVISMESADPILRPEQLPEWWRHGVRVMGPVHYGPGRYGGGTGTELGLTDLGVRLLEQMERLGIILDLSHFSDQAFWEALDRYDGPVLASHNNCRALVPHQRQFSDEQLRAIIDRDGVVGCAFDVWMLEPGWTSGHSTNQGVKLDTVVDHIDHICQLAGNSHHAGIGSDLDGGFGRPQSPSDLNTIADLQRVPALLEQRGYRDADTRAIMHGNWLKLLRRSWG